MENYMKPYEEFVENMLRAVRSGQGKDPMAATALIQDALKAAGLMGASPTEVPAQAFEQTRDQAREQAGAAPFVDLNPPPAWAPGARQGADERAAKPEATAGAMPDWVARFKSRMPGMPGQGFGAPGKTVSAETHGPGQFLSGSFTNEAGTRNYRLYVPSKPASGPRPLVVMLHGCKQNPEDFAAGTTMNLLAEENGCLVLYPEQAGTANHSHCWNWFEQSHQGRGQGEPSLIAGMTQEVVREHGLDAARVYVAGLSAGGAMAAVMAAAYPELYAAAGVHSGLPIGSAHDLMSALNAMKGAPRKKRKAASGARPVPVIVFHGDRDAIVHPSNGEAVYQQLTQGTSVRETEERGDGHTRTTALDAAGKVVAEHWTMHGAGHAWSGGSAAGSYAEPSGPNASAEMLRFFLAQRPH
jgi:poly(hydroxyalkanoate) depolymerase family esterase